MVTGFLKNSVLPQLTVNGWPGSRMVPKVESELQVVDGLGVL